MSGYSSRWQPKWLRLREASWVTSMPSDQGLLVATIDIDRRHRAPIEVDITARDSRWWDYTERHLQPEERFQHPYPDGVRVHGEHFGGHRVPGPPAPQLFLWLPDPPDAPVTYRVWYGYLLTASFWLRGREGSEYPELGLAWQPGRLEAVVRDPLVLAESKDAQYAVRALFERLKKPGRRPGRTIEIEEVEEARQSLIRQGIRPSRSALAVEAFCSESSVLRAVKVAGFATVKDFLTFSDTP